MTPADLATLSLLDPQQGVCPEGHPCRLVNPLGDRACGSCDYRGPALICWDITDAAIESAAARGADRRVVDSANGFLHDRSSDSG